MINYMISGEVYRRQLHPYLRGLVGLRLLEVYEKEGIQAMSEGGKLGGKAPKKGKGVGRKPSFGKNGIKNF